MDLPKIKVRQCDAFITDLCTRMPFKYGIATMTDVPHLFLRVNAEVNGRSVSGVAADLLPPKWFTKVPEKPVADEVTEMIRVIEHAAKAAVGLEESSVFRIWQQIFHSQAQWGLSERFPPLLTHFGTSLIERAIIDAACRALNLSFSRALQAGALGIELEHFHSSLRGHAPSEFLPRNPFSRVTVRHTVGLADYLTDAEIPKSEWLDDGLPQSLSACIARYGLRHFKIKITGQIGHDLARLKGISEVLQTECRGKFQFSLDGNEQFKCAEDFRCYWEEIQPREDLRTFWNQILFIEQPIHRDTALDPSVGIAFSRWNDCPAIIIDESDGDLDSLHQALALGYAGTSHKNCKGVFKGIANSCLLRFYASQNKGKTFLMSGEDLCNIGPVAIMQDLAVMAAMGIESIERNGHHYFLGLSMFPKDIQEDVLADHPDLYHRTPMGWAAIRIENGSIQIDSLNSAPFGTCSNLNIDQFTPLQHYTRVR